MARINKQRKIYTVGMLWLLVYGVTSFSASFVLAQKNPVQACLDLVYNMKMDSVQLVLPTIADENIRETMELFAWRWKAIPVAQRDTAGLYKKKIQHAIDRYPTKSLSAEKLFFLQINHLMLAEYFYNQKKVWDAASYAKKLYAYMDKLIEKNEKDPLSRFMIAMYLFYSDHMREKSFFYKVSMSPFRSGDKKLGIEYLEQLANKESIIQTEAVIFISHIYLDIVCTPEKARPYVEWLITRYPDNSKFREVFIQYLIETKKYSEAMLPLKVQQQIKDPYFQIPCLYFQSLLHWNQHHDSKSCIHLLNTCSSLISRYNLCTHYRDKINVLKSQCNQYE